MFVYVVIIYGDISFALRPKFLAGVYILLVEDFTIPARTKSTFSALFSRLFIKDRLKYLTSDTSSSSSSRHILDDCRGGAGAEWEGADPKCLPDLHFIVHHSKADVLV